MEDIKICTYCGKDAETCDDKFDLINSETGTVIATGVKQVWGNNFALSAQMKQKEGK